MNKIQLVIFNLQHSGAKRATEIVRYLEQANCNVAILSEYMQGNSRLTDLLSSRGYQVQSSTVQNGEYGVLLACKEKFDIRANGNRWVEAFIPAWSLYVLGVYVPDGEGPDKDGFWKQICDYAKNRDKDKALFAGDLNSCVREDSSSSREFSSDKLLAVKSLGWVDTWVFLSNEKYTTF